MLPIALACGLEEVDPPEPLKAGFESVFYHHIIIIQNLDTGVVIDAPDSNAQFFLSTGGSVCMDRSSALLVLQDSWSNSHPRPQQRDIEWTNTLSAYLTALVDQRVNHVQEWITSNLSRFKTDHANIEILRRAFDSLVVELRSNVDLCKMQCYKCQLLCLRGRHDPDVPHDCQTTHRCIGTCEYDSEHQLEVEIKLCGLS